MFSGTLLHGGGGDRRGGYGGNAPTTFDRNLPSLTETKNKFVINVERGEEEKKQRAFKAILNKLTFENFEKLLEKAGPRHSPHA